MNSTKTIFGIDLGTTYSCIAYVDEYGQAVIIPNNEGSLTTPSVVHFDKDNRIVGKEAKNSAVLYPDEIVTAVKRHMGGPGWRFEYKKNAYSAEEISSYILRKLADDARRYLGRPVQDVVITCPAYFGIAQRDATIRAGQIAGFNVRDIINEPTAAAITYGLQSEQDQVVLVYDLGGGTFDITVIQINNGEITVISTGGDNNLGGRNWDESVLIYLAEQWKAETGMNDDPTESEETMQDLWDKAEQVKWALTARQEARVAITHLGHRVGITLTRPKFEELTANLLERTIVFTRDTLKDARARGFADINQILLVGGSTKMPQVAGRLRQELALPIRAFEPDTAVAKGAAIYAQKLVLDEEVQNRVGEITATSMDKVNIDDVPQRLIHDVQQAIASDNGLLLDTVKRYNDLKVINVTSHSFGVIVKDQETSQDFISNIIMVNDQLPTTQTKTYHTLQANQEAIEIKVMENSLFAHRLDDFAQAEEIGHAILHLPPRLPLHSPIEVRFELQKDGRLHMTAREPRHDISIEIEIQTRHGLSDKEMHKAQDRSRKLFIS
ncbi:MAG: Hsp70 family protein [Ktedonobacteraceae bacterium]